MDEGTRILIILKYDADLFGECLAKDIHKAAETGQLLVLKKFVEEQGVDANYPDKDGNTALHWACLYGTKFFRELHNLISLIVLLQGKIQR